MKIEKLALHSNNFPAQFQFYVETLGLELVEKNENSFSLRIGNSMLTFKKSATKCYYHFAFNIPPFQIMEAMEWAQRRVDLLKHEGETILDFPNWNAKAFYFFDADHNIVEFIDRRNIEIKTNNAFSAKNILEISEIGLPVDNIKEAFQKLNLQTGIKKYSGNLETFCAAGDEHGLFIIVNQKTKNWLPTNLPAKAFPFELNFQNDQENYLLNCNGKDFLSK